MSFLTKLFSKRYKAHPEAVIISCFFNPMNSPYRLMVFRQFHKTISHLEHRIIECVIGDSAPQLGDIEGVERVHTESLLWHKEALLNGIIAKLPSKFRYVFWVDADVLFTNPDWLCSATELLQAGCNILQPFEFCVHLNRDEKKPNFSVADCRPFVSDPTKRQPQVWRSFCANYSDARRISESENYDRHGHVGFAWGARRSVLQRCPLYDRALIGGADHIIAHSAAGQIPSPCITKAFGDDIEAVEAWMHQFHEEARRKVGFVGGDLYHLWHGDVDRRQYLKRIRDYTPKTKSIKTKDRNGLYVNHRRDDVYVRNYFQQREVNSSGSHDDGFLASMAVGYMTDSPLVGGLVGGNFIGGMVGASLHSHSDESQHGNSTVIIQAPAEGGSHTNTPPIEIEAPGPQAAVTPASDNFS